MCVQIYVLRYERHFDRFLLQSPCNGKNLAVTSYSAEIGALWHPSPHKGHLDCGVGTKEAEGARNGEAGILCALVYITAGCIAGKRCETAALMVVKLLSKAISDQIRSADGFVMTLPCMFALALAR